MINGKEIKIKNVIKFVIGIIIMYVNIDSFIN